MITRRWPARLLALYRHSPTFLLASWFLAFTILGAVLLALPISQRQDGPGLGLLGSLFTAVSAFCVTGLTLADTYATFTGFGQAIILALIELGGVGVMTFASLAFAMFGRRLSLVQQAALTDSLLQNNAAKEFGIIFRSMLKVVVLVQLAGLAVLFAALSMHPASQGAGALDRLWSAAFHSVSAFCNAGFSIYPNNLVAVAENELFLFTVAVLVILGGIGLGVLAELYRRAGKLFRPEKKYRRLSFNTTLVLLTTAFLLVAGGLSLGLTDLIYGDGSSRIADSLFHSVVARTAGFNSSNLETLPLPSCLVLCMLMFVGGSPGSCAGGIKTTSLAIWIARIGLLLRHDSNVNILGYSIPLELVRKARLIIALSCLWMLFGVTLLCLSQPAARLDVLLFEQISAMMTVGLSMGYTPHLNWFSQIWIILSMILGKFGPLTIALGMVPSAPGRIKGPEGKLMIG